MVKWTLVMDWRSEDGKLGFPSENCFLKKEENKIDSAYFKTVSLMKILSKILR
jgi:hypothetical protein